MADRLSIAFVPLVDCAVLVAAREIGFAAERGLALELVREPSWASLRDHLNLGFVDAAHALAPLPIAAALGAGQVTFDAMVPFVLGRGGNAITVSRALGEELRQVAGAEPRGPEGSAAALAAVVRRRRTPLTLAMVYPFSGHNFELRYWLAAGGVHPDRDVRLVSIPPPLMVASLRAGHVDGFCVGEPWNGLAAAEGIGEILVTKSQIFPRGVEKVLAVPGSMETEPDLLRRLLEALDAAARWADAPDNHPRLAALLARSEYLDVPESLIRGALSGRPGGDAARSDAAADPEFLYFHRHAANVPRAEEALWLYAQMLRWGQLRLDEHDAGRAAAVYREDLYWRCLGREPGGEAAFAPAAAAAFDGVRFDARDIRAYVERFRLRTPFVGSAPDLQA